MISNLIKYLKKVEGNLYIQTHDYPDPDAVSSAFALQQFLEHHNIYSSLMYNGDIQRENLQRMIRKLGIRIYNMSEYNLTDNDKIIIIDGCKGQKNVTDLVGEEIAIIDHHNVVNDINILFHDIRPNYGSCCTIIYDYFNQFNISIPKNVATALMVGISIDTSFLTRGVSKYDISAYYFLYSKANIQEVNSLLRNQFQVKDLNFYRKAIENIEIIKSFAFLYFEDGCNQNLMGMLGDFFLAVGGIDFVVLCAKNNNHINFSIRNERDYWDAGNIIQEVLDGIGFGGGHYEMAGGIILDSNLFDKDQIKLKFLNKLKWRN